jgi:hypothetical protein
VPQRAYRCDRARCRPVGTTEAVPWSPPAHGTTRQPPHQLERRV